MTYSPLGYSLPNLAVTGYAAQEAAWGGLVRGQRDGPEPGGQLADRADPPGSDRRPTPATGDTSDHPERRRLAADHGRRLRLDQAQRDDRPGQDRQHLDPQRAPEQPVHHVEPRSPCRASRLGFPSNGGKVFITFIIEGTQTVAVKGQYPDFYRVPLPVKIVNPLPNLQVIAEDLPSSLQPGDVITPTIRIANLGAGEPGRRGRSRSSWSPRSTRTSGRATPSSPRTRSRACRASPRCRRPPPARSTTT